MSRAFVKDADGSEVGQDLPERLVSPHRNLVTPRGLAQIDEALRRLRDALAEAREKDDRAEIALHERDLRYWSQRRASAEMVPYPTEHGTARFGARVVLEKPDGTRHAFQIVGEDEADPTAGLLSYVSPLGDALLGSTIGDPVEFGGHTAEVVAIE